MLVILWTALRICYSHFVQTLLLAFLHYFTCVLLFHLLSVYVGMCVLSLLNKDMMMMMVRATACIFYCRLAGHFVALCRWKLSRAWLRFSCTPQ